MDINPVQYILAVGEIPSEGGGGGERGGHVPHDLEGGGHNIKCPPSNNFDVPPRLGRWGAQCPPSNNFEVPNDGLSSWEWLHVLKERNKQTNKSTKKAGKKKMKEITKWEKENAE